MRRLYEPQAYASKIGSYWETTVNAEPWPKLTHDIRAKTAIIGGGYTGLNCALHLVQSGIDPESIIILDAEQPGWGASGRNGGFCCMGGSKLSIDQTTARFGQEESLRYFQTQINSVKTVRDNLSNYSIKADTHSHGETQLAYRPSQIEELAKEKEVLHERFAIKCEFTERAKMTKNGLNSPEFYAALTNPVGFALNPIKYAFGLAKASLNAGIQCFGGTAALRIENNGGSYQIHTKQGMITAERLVIATNGYSSEDIPNWLSGRLMPVLTNIIATRPLTESELYEQGWTSHQMCYDTRHSLHYFRLMPGINGEGPRMLFGMRGGSSASDRSSRTRHHKIRTDFERIFPKWRHVETPYFWSGLVCMTKNQTSYTGPVPDMPNAFASLAYHGNGVAMASHCGQLLGKMLNGEMDPSSIPAAMRQIPEKFPFAFARRLYLETAFRWYEWKDG